MTQARTRTVADGANLLINTRDNGRYQLGKGILTTVSISNSGAGSGPVLVNAVLEFDRNQGNRLSLGSARWVRGYTTFGFRETWIWNGEIEVDQQDDILFQVRNDTGSAVVVTMTWTVQ